MDIRKTMEFIVEQQAAMAVNLAKAEERQTKTDEQLAKLDEQLAKMAQQQARTDKRVDAIAKIVKVGMRMLVSLGDSQKKTEGKLDRLLESMLRKSGNGRR